MAKRKDKKETKESKKPKNSKYQIKQRARNRFVSSRTKELVAEGHTKEEGSMIAMEVWREGRRNGTITI